MALSLINDCFSSGKFKGSNYYSVIKTNPDYLYYLYINRFGDSKIKEYLKRDKLLYLEDGRDREVMELSKRLKDLYKERFVLQNIVAYQKEFIDFCKCGNPKDDCICAELL